MKIERYCYKAQSFVDGLISLFSIVCPECNRRLSRARSEDALLDYHHTCYKCGHEFIEGGDGLE
jgi:uncharacterized protein with PIN domain